MGKRIRAFLLGFSMLVSVLNPSIVYAEEPPVDETPIEVIDEEEPVEVAEEPVDGEDPGEEPEILPEGDEPEIIVEPEETVEPEATPVPEEEIIQEETEEPSEPDEEPEEAAEEAEEDTVLFEAPDGFELSEAEAQEKQTLKELNILSSFDNLQEGRDYVKNQLIFLTDDLAYAEKVAEIYHAELTKFGYGVAVITITDPDISVKDVFTASVDEDFALPLVEPNYITYLDPEERRPAVEIEDATLMYDLPDVLTWKDWVSDVFWDPDPSITTPSEKEYQWQHTTLNTYAGWNATFGSGVTVAVLDQGVNPNHVDLKDRVTTHELEFYNKEEGEWQDHGFSYGGGHGTHVAGIIGATVDNGEGGAGIAPDVDILSVDVFGTDDVGCSDDVMIAALNYVTDEGVDIVNMSLGGPMYSAVENMAIQHAYLSGVVLVAAAGNDGSNIKSFPAAYDHVIAVASVNRNGVRADYSNYGPWITVSAPGSDIFSTISTEDGEFGDDGFDFMSGTSMACPVVSGALALYMSKFGHKNYDEILPIIKSSTNKCSSKQMGAGIISVEKMFSKKATAPDIEVYDGITLITNFKDPVPEGSRLSFNAEDLGYNETLIYTVDGKNPAVKNGQIVSGNVYDWYPISIDDTFVKGTTVTVKAAVVNELGVLGNIKTLKFKAPKVKAVPVKVKSVSLETTKATLGYKEFHKEQFYLNIKTLKDVNGADRNLSDYDYKWISSNPKVATVDQGGEVIAEGPGTAKITLKMLDGSGKTAVCTVTVNQLAESLEIKGQEGMAPGTTATFSASVLPSTTKNKKVTWEFYGEAPEGVTLKGSKVTVASTAAVGTVFGLKATTTDGTDIDAYRFVTIEPKASAIRLDAPDPLNPSERDSRAVYNKKDVLTTINLFTVDIEDDSHPKDDSGFMLETTITGNDIPPVFTSSNPKVATVSSEGWIKAIGKGTAKITATANDGSKKKATVTVKVTVPVSNINIDLGEYYFLCVGKSLNLKDKAKYGAQYGAPGKKSVVWSISKVEYTTSEEVTYDLTNSFIRNKWAYIASNSKLTLSKNITDYWDVEIGNLDIYLRADSQDGTGYYYDQYEYKDAGEGIRVKSPQGSVIFDDYGGGWYIYGDSKESNSGGFWLFSTNFTNFQITSSNPKVSGAMIDYDNIEYGWDYVYQKGRPKYVKGYWYPVYFFSYPGKKGTATITAKALDGSGKSAKVKVKIR